MLERESLGDGWQVRIPVSGAARAARVGIAAFMCVWLCGWAVGEWFAGGTLAGMIAARAMPGADLSWLPHLRGASANAPAVAIGFLAVWFIGWTIGGAFAIATLVSVVAGAPIVRWNASGVELVMQVGPFASRRRLAWEDAERVLQGGAPQGRAAGRAGVHVFTPLALAPEDRDTLLAWLREARSEARDSTPGYTAIS
jgi:hypothetical protein